MEYRPDNKSGNKLSALGFGCMRLPRARGGIDQEKTTELIQRAIEGGVNYFDTAYIYPGSEEALGKALADGGLREKAYIATKLPLILLKNASDFDRFFNKQLERLQTGYIDYYLMHMLTDMELWKKLTGWGIEEWLEKKKASGQIKRIGFSFHGSKNSFLSLLDAYDWELCQIQYNYLNENYQAGVEGLRKAHAKGIPVIIMEPLLGGRLAGGLPEDAVRALRDADPSISPASWAFRWLWSQPEPTVVLSGMSRASDLSDNLKTAETAFRGALSEKEAEAVKRVVEIVNASYKIRCTGCGYCMPCPRNVNIPACFQSYNTSFAHGRAAGIQQYITSTGGTAGMGGGAGRCVECGKCEAHCPQSIKIRAELANVKRRMEPLWYRAAIATVRIFMGGIKK